MILKYLILLFYIYSLKKEEEYFKFKNKKLIKNITLNCGIKHYNITEEFLLKNNEKGIKYKFNFSLASSKFKSMDQGTNEVSSYIVLKRAIELTYNYLFNKNFYISNEQISTYLNKHDNNEINPYLKEYSFFTNNVENNDSSKNVFDYKNYNKESIYSYGFNSINLIKVEKLKSWDSNVIKDFLMKNGPVISYINANLLYKYKSGIWRKNLLVKKKKIKTKKDQDKNKKDISICRNEFYEANHIVLITGFGYKDNILYFEILNSFGEDFGEKHQFHENKENEKKSEGGGYFYLLDFNNTCGILNCPLGIKVN